MTGRVSHVGLGIWPSMQQLHERAQYESSSAPQAAACSMATCAMRPLHQHVPRQWPSSSRKHADQHLRAGERRGPRPQLQLQRRRQLCGCSPAGAWGALECVLSWQPCPCLGGCGGGSWTAQARLCLSLCPHLHGGVHVRHLEGSDLCLSVRPHLHGGKHVRRLGGHVQGGAVLDGCRC